MRGLDERCYNTCTAGVVEDVGGRSDGWGEVGDVEAGDVVSAFAGHAVVGI
jgi:hypothetical protein